MRGVLRANKTLRLTHVDNLIKIVMKKCVLDIELFDTPLPRNCNTEYKSGGVRLNHRAERLMKVYTVGLVKPLGDKDPLVAIHTAIGILILPSRPSYNPQYELRRGVEQETTFLVSVEQRFLWP